MPKQFFQSTRFLHYICHTVCYLNAFLLLFTIQVQKLAVRLKETKKRWEEKSTTMLPMVGGKLSKSEENYPNARQTRAPESVQFQEK